MPRVPTGLPGLDTVLQGGLIRGGITLLQGSPGVGKTTVASQMSFAHVRAGGRVLYTTMLSESHARLMLHLRSFDFFDASAIGRSLHYLSGYSVLESGGLNALLELLRREMRAKQASLLVLDGVVALRETSESEQALKKFVHELQIHAELTGCTVVMLTSGMRTSRAELTMVDGLIKFVYTPRGDRFLKVRKLRGSAFLPNLHPFVIDSHGATVYPRLEVLHARPLAEDPCREGRLSTGIATLDGMLGGGLPCDTTTMVLGASGAGKTTLGIHFLAQSTPKEPGLHFGFYETPQRLRLKARRIGLPLEKLEQSGALTLRWFPPTSNLLDALADTLLREVRQRKVRRLFIDGLGGFLEAARRIGQEERVSHFFTALSNELRVNQVTTLYSHESRQLIGPEVEAPLTGVSTILENLIVLRLVEAHTTLHRLLSITKVRDSDHDPSVREFHITSKGIHVESTSETAHAILGSALLPTAARTRTGTKRTGKKRPRRRAGK